MISLVDIIKNNIIETTLCKSVGKEKRKALIVKTDILNKKVSFVVLSDYQEVVLNTIEEAIESYSKI